MMDNQKLIKKIDELLEVLKAEQQERKGTEEEISWVKLEGQLEEYKENLNMLLYKRQITDLCKYEYQHKYSNIMSDFNDVDCQSIVKLIIEYAEFEKSRGKKLSNSTIISMFKYGLILYSHGYSINNIDYLTGVMLGALLSD